MLTRGFRRWAPLVFGVAWGFSPDARPQSNPPPARPDEAGADEVKVILPEDAMTITDKASTVPIPLTPKLRSQVAEAIARYPDATVRLSIRGVCPPFEREATCGFNLFLNKTDADATTPEADHHFVRAVEFAPTNESTRQGFNVNLLKTLAELHRRKELDIAEPLRITIVPIPARGVSRIPEEASFSVRELRLTVPTHVREQK